MQMEGPLVIRRDTVLDPGIYPLPEGILIEGDNLTLDGNGALLVGSNRQGRGVTLHNRHGVTIKNLRIRDYYHGLAAVDCKDLTVAGCQVTSMAEIAANTVFLDIWKDAEEAYGGGILLNRCLDCRVVANDLQHQMTGLSSYGCANLTVSQNNASYCSAWGFHMYETCDSLYEANVADYCCRYEPRGERQGHLGADAAGFLIIYASCRNTFRRNLARMGGDGFFLAGLSPRWEKVPCNDNRFEENDGSYSPNIAFEATFSARNVYYNNYANHCNYGFWLGFSRDGLVEGNQINENVRAGIATENGFGFTVSGNHFEQNEYGVLLWSKFIPEFAQTVPENETSFNWQILENTFIRNHKGIRIAANQDHGVRPYRVPEGQDPRDWFRPHDHSIRKNTFKDNRIGIEVYDSERPVLQDNLFVHNVEADTILPE